MFEALQVMDIERAIAASLSGVATEGEVRMKHLLRQKHSLRLSMNFHDMEQDSGLASKNIHFTLNTPGLRVYFEIDILVMTLDMTFHKYLNSAGR